MNRAAFAEELRLLASRRSAQAVLAVSVALGLAVVLAGMAWRAFAPVPPAGMGVDLRGSGVQVAGWGLVVRNFFVLPLLLVLATASSFAGDLEDRSLRELLLAPVGRAEVLVTRLFALATLALASNLATLLVAVPLGGALLGLGDDLGRLVLGYGASALSDMALLAAATFVALLTRSTSGTVVTLTFGLAVDLVVRTALRSSAGLVAFGITLPFAPERLVPLTFGAALSCWDGWQDGYEMIKFFGLFAWGALFFALARLRFGHTEVT